MYAGKLLEIYVLTYYTPLWYDAKFGIGLCSCTFFCVSILCTK